MDGRSKLLVLAITSYCDAANAGFITTGGIDGGNNGQLSSLSGACTVDFNSGNAINSCGATYTGISSATNVNYVPTSGATQIFFDRIIYASSANAFETDNQTFGQATPDRVGSVPEPGSTALLGIAGLALLASRKRRREV